MALLLDSFWRAAAYCMLPRVVVASLLPLLVIGALTFGLGYFYWDAAVHSVRMLLDSPGWLNTMWGWLRAWGLGDAAAWVAPLIVVVVVTPIIVLLSLLGVALLMTPSLVALVADRRFASLEHKKGGPFWMGLGWSLGSTLMAGAVLLLSMPLWLLPPLVLVLPPLIWGWLTYRVMAFDALAEHASKSERQLLFQRHRMGLLAMGVVSGYLGAAPAIVWASGVVFAAAFFVLIPLAIWIYTLVFVFSSLWFAHFCLAALERLRAEPLSNASPSPSPSPSPSIPAQQP